MRIETATLKPSINHNRCSRLGRSERRTLGRRFARWLLGILVALVATGNLSVARADITLSPIFSDNMVLQRNTTARCFGTAEANQKLKIEFRDFSKEVTADEKGNWFVNLPVGKAGGPFELSVTAVDGEPKVKLSNVMSGEVWLCAGQANMHLPVSKVLNSKTEIEQSVKYPNIRLLTIPETASRQPLQQTGKVVGWDVCSPKPVAEFSATAYFFARELSKQFPDMPVGVINASSESASCEAWVSHKRLAASKDFKSMLEYWDGIETKGDSNRPSVLFNGMIAPIQTCSFQGVIWYQGEQNVGRGSQYLGLMETLIVDWRNHFKKPEMPFYFVQLAPFRYETKPEFALPEVWDAQRRVAINVPKTGMVVTTDIGDIENFQPANKQEVGRRLALIALGKTYKSLLKENKEVAYSGPIFKKAIPEENRIVLEFDFDEGLAIRGEDAALSCFTICGEDQVFVPAEAKIVGTTIEVSSPKVPNPKAVRFAWTDTAQPNLINGTGLPASPFRTDDFPLPSKDRVF